MINYCTLFDKNYLIFGLALKNSLDKFMPGKYKLFILAMDEMTYEILNQLNLSNVTVIKLEKVLFGYEIIKTKMNFGQICWTCQPLLCRYILDTHSVESITYLEADSYFFNSPEQIYNEIGDRSVSLVPHNYSIGYDQTKTSGKYCVQYNLFRNNAVGKLFLGKWLESCLLYNKLDPTYLPGQICLDEWPNQSMEVAVVGHLGAGVAPWNINSYKLSSGDSGLMVNGHELIFFHYHQLSFIKNGFFLSSYNISNKVKMLIYKPYLDELLLIKNLLRIKFPEFNYTKKLSAPKIESHDFNFFKYLVNLIRYYRMILTGSTYKFKLYD